MVQFWSSWIQIRFLLFSWKFNASTHKPWIERNDFKSFSYKYFGVLAAESSKPEGTTHECPVLTVIGAPVTTLLVFHTCECIICHAGEKGYGRNIGLAMCWRGLTLQTLLFCDNSSTSMLETCVGQWDNSQKKGVSIPVAGRWFFISLESKLCLNQIL